MIQDRKDQKGQPGPTVQYRDRKVRRETLVQQGHRVILGRQVPLVQLAQQGLLVRLVLLARVLCRRE